MQFDYALFDGNINRTSLAVN